jgi:hypothetical protein
MAQEFPEKELERIAIKFGFSDALTRNRLAASDLFSQHYLVGPEHSLRSAP